MPEEEILFGKQWIDETVRGLASNLNIKIEKIEWGPVDFDRDLHSLLVIVNRKKKRL